MELRTPLRLWKAKRWYSVFWEIQIYEVCFRTNRNCITRFRSVMELWREFLRKKWSRVSKILENVLFAGCKVTFGIHKHVSFALSECKISRIIYNFDRRDFFELGWTHCNDLKKSKSKPCRKSQRLERNGSRLGRFESILAIGNGLWKGCSPKI